ncbi:MAG: lipid IV(A) 3-deoxy-D-manno-octulosonic acid transferase [Pseudomonadota bacterium]|nr:lipid IV(A) 3-deoxy-D-manno-octulosonic acid transferase [Pseudomonadota bacterium]
MRVAYQALTYLLMPVYAGYWFVRGISNRAYWECFGQRFGKGYPDLSAGCIWLHAVSIGDVQAAVPLIKALFKRYPHLRILVTTVTPTGAARVRLLFGDSVEHCYIPFETPNAVKKFFNAVNPRIALIMETEIWPNLYHECGQRKIPLVLVSARISPKSVDNYRKFLPLFRETLSHGIIIAAQSEMDADRFRELGAAEERTWVTGNIKFDFELHEGLERYGDEFRRDNFGDRHVWVAASTHEHEEEQVLRAHKVLCERFPDSLLVLIPRHPERFSVVRRFLEKSEFRYISRTDRMPCTPDIEVFLGDTMGEVPFFYAACNVAFVGGTLVPVGGHNLLEPAAVGKPVITGPYLYNTQDIADKFQKHGASITVNNPVELGTAVENLFANPERAADIGNRGRQIVRHNRGALDRLLRLLEPLVDRAIG